MNCSDSPLVCRWFARLQFNGRAGVFSETNDGRVETFVLDGTLVRPKPVVPDAAPAAQVQVKAEVAPDGGTAGDAREADGGGGDEAAAVVAATPAPVEGEVVRSYR